MTGAPPKLDPARATLIVVDVQEGFRKAIPGFDGIAASTAALVRGAAELGVPVIVTEQYPKGLGSTVPEVAEHLPEGVDPLPKTVFSAAAADGFDLGGRDQAVVCGIEAHVCVNQTVLDLLDRGYEVHVAADATSSRAPTNKALALERMAAAGAHVTSSEMALFEMLEVAGSPEFKAISKLVR